MDLHQIQVTYQPEEDRLLGRVSFKDADGRLHEIRVWFTRRFVGQLWPGIVQTLEAQVAQEKPQAAHASTDIVGMEHHATVQQMQGNGNFNNRYESNVAAFPLGEAPILAISARISQEPGKPIRIKMMPTAGTGFEIAFARPILHGFCTLLSDAVKKASWDLKLEMPGSAPPDNEERVLN